MVGANFIDLNVKKDNMRPSNQQWSTKWKSGSNKERGQMIKDFVRYMGRIEGTAIDETCVNHSCFGKFINEDRTLEQLSMNELRRYTSFVAEKGTEMFNTVISLKEDEAIRTGFTDRETWKNMINKKVKDIAEEYGIEQSNLEFIASVHSEEGHIHCHLMFWKTNELEDGRIEKRKNWSEIRKSLNKEIFQKELEENYELQNRGKKELGKDTKEFLERRLKNSIQELTPNLYTKYFNNKVNKKSLDTLEEMITNIIKTQNKLAKENNTKIRYMYKYQPPEIKKLLLDAAQEVVNSSISCRKEFNSYVESSAKINEILGKVGKKNTIDVIKSKAENEMLTKVANNILDFIKSEKQEENILKKKEYIERNEQFQQKLQLIKETKEEKQAEYEKNLLHNQLRRLCRSSYYTCQNNAISQRATLKKAINYSNLTKQAKKEMALKNKFKGAIDWER